MSFKVIESLSEKLGLDFQDREDGIYQLWLSNKFSFIEFKHIFTYLNSNYIEDFNEDLNNGINKNEYFLSFKIIFRSWHVSNDRTDFNDITPAVIAILLRLLSKNSFIIVDIEHPVIEGELYGRELIPTQNIDRSIDFSSEEQFSQLEEILDDFIFINNMLFKFFNCSMEVRDEYNDSDTLLNKWSKKISKTLNIDIINFNLRTNPQWFFFKSNNISIVKNENICFTIYNTILDKRKISIISGESGELLIEENIKNYIDFKVLKKAKKFFKKLENYNGYFFIIPLDNISAFVGEKHIVFIKSNSDLDKFIKEREIVKQRHIKELNILFKEETPQIIINTKEDSIIFENLILELLKRESFIFWAKKVSVTNEADNGRDIICKFNSKYKSHILKENEVELDYKKLIVQCKTKSLTSKKQSIGKSDVNIIDTIYDYNPDGYILVTNTQISTRLTEHLEKIEEKEKIFIDWWNKEDIEERLIKHPELISKFSSIIKYERD